MYTPPSGNAVLLVFFDDSPRTVQLDFDPGASTGFLTATADDSVADFAGSFFQPVYVGTLLAVADDAVASLSGAYDPNVWRGKVRSLAETWDRAGSLNGMNGIFAFGSNPKRSERGGTWLDAPGRPATARNAWRAGNPKVWAVPFAWDDSRGHPGASSPSRWRGPPRKRGDRRMAFDAGHPFSASFTHPFANPPRRRVEVRWRWGGSMPSASDHRASWDRADASVAAWRIVWRQARGLAWFPYTPDKPPPPEPWRYVPSGVLAFSCETPRWNPLRLEFVFARSGCPWRTPLPPPGGTLVVNNSISVVALPGRVPVRATSLSLALDWGDWTWGLSMGLKGRDAMDAISPVDGDPVAVEVSINGFVWIFQVEGFTENERFGSDEWTATGRSPAAMFAAPLAPASTRLEESDRLAAQLLDGLLGSSGWTMAYHASLADLLTTQWLVPGGCFGYQDKTPLEAMAAVSGAIGARLHADRNAETFHLDPAYAAMPWEWADATPDAVVPLSVATSHAPALATKPGYNQVFVAGSKAGGQLVSVTRRGTAGDVPAPMVTDPLITHPLAGRERARSILGDTGKQSLVPVELPLILDPGLLMPGYLVDVRGSRGDWRGMVRSVAIDAAFPTVKQTVQIERHH